MSARRRLVLSIIALLSVLLIGAIGYCLIEVDRKPTFLDAVYMTVITLSTVGYGEVWVLSPIGKLWTIGVIILGVATASYALSSLVSLVVSGELRSLREKKKMESTIDRLRDHVVLCGHGRMGALVVQELRHREVPVVVIEVQQEQEDELRKAQIPYLIGDATEESTLMRAGLMRARSVVIALPSDADNVYVALTASALRADLTIVARAEHPAAEAKLKRAGATRTVCPRVAGAMRVVNILTRPTGVDFVELANKGIDLEIDEYLVGEQSVLVGKTLREAAIRSKTASMVVAIKRAQGEAVLSPTADTVVRAKDTLILSGPAGVSERLDDIGLRSDTHGP